MDDTVAVDGGGVVRTAGAYVVLDGRVPFMVGPTPRGDRLAVFRLGGHREPGESPWECAAREAREEATLHIRPLAPPHTYWAEGESATATPVPRSWPGEPAGGVPPLLVVKGPGARAGALSVMYLALASGDPIPAAETRGLLLLDRAEVLRLARTPPTFAEYLRSGGCAILREELPTHLPLEPFLQLRLLATLLLWHPELLREEHR